MPSRTRGAAAALRRLTGPRSGRTEPCARPARPGARPRAARGPPRPGRPAAARRALPGRAGGGRRPARPSRPAVRLPGARSGWRAAAVPGCRVRVRFAGQLTGGYLLGAGRRQRSSGQAGLPGAGGLARARAEPEIADLARAVADRYARHAGRRAAAGHPAAPRPDGGARAAAQRDAGGGRPAPDGQPRGRRGPRPAGRGRGRATRRARPSWPRWPTAARRAPVWSALPGPHWPEEIARPRRRPRRPRAAARSSSCLTPGTSSHMDARARRAARQRASTSACRPGSGPAERYRRWLTVLRGRTRMVAGTRAAMFAPVRDLGLVVHLGRRGRSARRAAGALSARAGGSRAAGAPARRGRADRRASPGPRRPTQLVGGRLGGRPRGRPGRRCAAARRWSPRPGDDAELARDEAARSARLPEPGAAHGPGGAGPRAGALSRCRGAATWPRSPASAATTGPGAPACGGPLALAGPRPAALPLVRRGPTAGWRCPRVRAHRPARPGYRRRPHRRGTRPRLPRHCRCGSPGGADGDRGGAAAPALVVATPGAEPRAEGGYAAAVLLDGWMLLGRASLRAAEEALRRWLNAAALVRPGPEGGAVVVVADSGLPAVQALIRWDPVTHAERELADRTALRFPPAVRMAALTGPGRRWLSCWPRPSSRRGRRPRADPAGRRPGPATGRARLVPAGR